MQKSFTLTTPSASSLEEDAERLFAASPERSLTSNASRRVNAICAGVKIASSAVVKDKIGESSAS
jgi:hypothetical protein